MSIQIESITLTATHMQQMVEFYDMTCSTNLQAFQPFPDATFYSGTLAGIPLTICPNHIANVDAKQNRQQFHFIVDSVHDTFISALNNGGTELSAIEENETSLFCSVYDPDGNSIVFSQPK